MVSAGSGTGDAAAAPTVPRWVYALAIGVPVTAALAYILFGPSDDEPKTPKPKAKSNPEPVAKSAGDAKTKPEVKTPKKEEKVTVEDVPEEIPTDPLERAVAAKNRGSDNNDNKYVNYYKNFIKT